MSYRILAFGATGKFGSLVVSALSERSADVRAFVMHEVDGATAIANGADEFVVGDLTHRVSVDRALQGVDAVFYLAPDFLPNEAEVGKGLVASCIAAGVKRFVFSSVIHPVLSHLPNHAGKAPVEEAVLESHLEYTFLHPTMFFQNYIQSWPELLKTGVLSEPWSVDTRFSRVDYRDIAEVAAIALTEDRLLYGTFELCAEGWLDRHDVAALISRSLDREIKAAKVDPATLGDEAEPMRPMFNLYDRVGLRGSALTLRAVLRREPRTLEAFFAELSGEQVSDRLKDSR